ncbi:hypothetical protein NEDG_01736 [Nematocida displodere]|uniref:Phosphatidic acid phosphatase type 2/haloperoxidase domain-containing protein n=1 Tax=Nematocida displodere TaxID=1805483 RepID=A0A177EDW4_9MICR|nr:hypothetical protein NEDG_01736 [Nematocida displodere]
MGLWIEVVLFYVVYVLVHSFFSSSEEMVLLGRERFGLAREKGAGLLGAEMKLVNRFGGLIPYVLVYSQVLEAGSSLAVCGVVVEVIVYIVVKDSVIAYLKSLKVFFPARSKLPLNPSGHTFMFVNGVFVLFPVCYEGLRRGRVSGVLALVIVGEYNRLLSETIRHYHTFHDVALGVVVFCVFRALVYPVRRAYGSYSYTNEWGIPEYVLVAAAVGVAIVAA